MSRFKAGKPDTNQHEIVTAYRALGASVGILSGVGGGVPDLVIGYLGITSLAEVKTAKGVIRKSQKDFKAAWRGGYIYIIRSIDDVIKHLNNISARV